MNRIYRIDRTALAAILFILSIPVEFLSTGSLHSNVEAYKLPVTAEESTGMNRIYRIDRTALAAILFILSIPVEFLSTGSLHSNVEAYKLPVTAVTMGDLNTGEIRNCALLLRRNRDRVLRSLTGVRFDNSFGSSDAESFNCRLANQQH